MKNTLYFIAFLFTFSLLFSCQDKVEKDEYSDWTEEQKRIYFQDSIAYTLYNGRGEDSSSLNNFNTFIDKMYPNVKAKYKDVYTYALEEPYIDTTKIDSTKNWFRLFLYPSFNYTYCFIVEKKHKKTYITVKMADRSAGQRSGTLDFSVTQIFSDSVYNSYSKIINKANFWKLEDDTTCWLLDGEYLQLEVIEEGKYNNIGSEFPCQNEVAILIEELRDSLQTKINFKQLYYSIKRETHYTYIYRRD